LTNIKQSEQNLDSTQQALKALLKELECLHSITNLPIDQTLSLEDILQRAVECIPSGFQYPEIICAKISYLNRSYTTNNFRKSKWMLASLIKVKGNDVGSVEVYYLKKPVRKIEDPFLMERKNLIISASRQLGVIIENKIVERELHIREEAIASAIVGIGFADLKGNVIYINEAFLRMWGYNNKNEVLGRQTTEFWKQITEVSKLRRTVSQKGAFTGELLGLRKDGTTFNVHLATHVVKDRSGTPINMMACFHDVTDQKRAEDELKESQAELRSLASHLLVLREQERKRMAHKIHDELGQELTVLKMDLSLLKEKLPTDQKNLLDLTKSMMKTIDKTAHTVQRISTELRPRLLDDVGLIPAIEWYVKEFQKHTRIKCEFFTDNEDINPDIKKSTVLFRVLQEALTNVARHASATRIKVSLSTKPDKLILKVRDNGKGITQNQISSSKSFGILGIRESVFSIKGKMEIKGIPFKSTTLKVSLPLDKD